MLERGHRVEGFERAADIFGLNSEIQGRQVINMGISNLPASFMGDTTNQSLYSSC